MFSIKESLSSTKIIMNKGALVLKDLKTCIYILKLEIIVEMFHRWENDRNVLRKWKWNLELFVLVY